MVFLRTLPALGQPNWKLRSQVFDPSYMYDVYI